MTPHYLRRATDLLDADPREGDGVILALIVSLVGLALLAALSLWGLLP